MSTEIVMFSGLVSRTSMRCFGSSTWIDVVTTGIVIRKMISSTSITSTSGVVLIAETTSSSSPSAGPTFIAMASGLGGCDFADISTAWRSAPKARTSSIARLLRRISQL